jgi:aminoglycoside phosphotransferase family enzyme
LLDAAAYPHEVGEIELVETHISWVILTGRYAYKIKKPVELGFLDFSTLEARRHFCEEELRVNRRTAPDLYLDVVPVGSPVRTEPGWAPGRRASSPCACASFRMPRGLIAACRPGFWG